MSGLLSITVAEAQGTIAIPADLDKLAIVVGCSSLGAGLSNFFLSSASAVAARGYGDAVDTLSQIIEQRQSSGTSIKFPAALYSTPASVPASYGTPDDSGVTGDALVGIDAGSLPFGTFEARLKFMTSGVVGSSGLTFQWSLDGGRTYSNTTALLSALFYVIPNSQVKFTFALAPIEGSTDATAGALYGIGGTLDGLTLILNVNGGGALTLNLNGATNTADEAALLAAIAVEWPALVATVNGATHLVLTDTTGGSVVIGAGTANAALGLTPGPYSATLNTGDVVAVRTFAPAPSAADIDAAFTALAMASVDFALVVCDWDMTAALAAHITTGLNALLAQGKRVTALVRTRIPDFEASEDDGAWNTSIAADWSTFHDDRIVKRATYEFITDAATTRQYLRSDLAQFAADVVRVDRAVWPGAPSDQAIANVILVDASGATIGHDEGPRGASTGLSDDTLGNSFSCVQRLPVPVVREAVYNCVPWTSYPPTSRLKNLMTRRVANAMERDAVAAGIANLGGAIFYTPADPAIPGSQPQLTDASRNAVHAVIFDALSVEFADDIQNADDGDVDTGLVQVNPVITITGGNLVKIAVTLAPLVLGYLLSLQITLAVQE